MGKLNWRGRFGSLAAAALVASCVAAPTAFAEEVYYDGTLDVADQNALPTTAVNYDDRVVAAATRAAMPAPEILGMVNIEESGQFVTFQGGQPIFTWAAPKYMLFASDYSHQPSWPLVNFAVGATDDSAIYNTSRAGGGAGPNAILAASGDATDELVWDMEPDIIIGDGGKSEEQLDNWRAGYDSSNYVKYDVSDYDALMDTVAAIGAASGDSDVIRNAALYNNYISRTFALTQAVEDDRYFALIAGVNEDGTYILGSAGQNGTAANNRYLEVASDAGAINLTTLVSDVNSVPANTVYDEETGAVVTYGLDYADVFLIGGQQSDAAYEDATKQLLKDYLLNDAYFVANNTNRGSSYGVVMNSIENAQNIGRILEALYPEVVSQRDYLAYYFQNFYHINSGNLPHVMDMALDGVRNWNRTITDWDQYFDEDGNPLSGAVESAVNTLTDWSASECGFSSESAEAALNTRFAV